MDIEADVEHRLCGAGWSNRCAAVVIDPELEAWIWSASPHVDNELGWHGRDPELRTWLAKQQFIQPGAVKPNDPKTAMREALRIAQKPLSSRIFSKLAETVGLSRCQDRAFMKLKMVLSDWFPLA